VKASENLSVNMDSSEKHSRTILLLGKEKFDKLQMSHVLIVGLGGVGSYAAEQICRAGVGKITIVDSDIIHESNLNRQLPALNSTIGKNKSDVLKNRLTDINKDVIIESINTFINFGNTESIIKKTKYNYIIDAIDTLNPKVNLIKIALKYKIPIVSSMGAGGKINPDKVEIADIGKTYNCGLARMLRKRLHKEGIRTGFKTVFSSEKTSSDAIISEEGQNKKTNVGTISYMPGIFGMFCASIVIRDLTEI